MGLPKFRGRGIGFSNGYLRSPGLGQTMKHSPGPPGIRPRFSVPPPGMPLQMQTLPPPSVRPPVFLPPPFHTGAPRNPSFSHHLPPPHLRSPLQPPNLPPSARPFHIPPSPRPPHIPPSPRPPHFSPSPQPPYIPPSPRPPHIPPMPRPPHIPPMSQPTHFSHSAPPPHIPPSPRPPYIPSSPRPPYIPPSPRPPYIPSSPRPPYIPSSPRPPHFPPSPRPPHLTPHLHPSPRPPHIPHSPYMSPIPPASPEMRGRQGLVGFGQTAPVLGKRGAASLRGGRGNAKVWKSNIHAGSNLQAGVHYCETCDKDLKDAEKLTLHLAEHTVCGRDGCTFQAHPKIIEKHVRVQHWSGLYKKICVANNPEDIAKWIQERKNRFPTKANIERREAERKEQMDRGERLEHEPQSFNSFPRGRGRNARRGMHNRMHGNHQRFGPKTDGEGKMEQAAEQEKSGENQSSLRGTGVQRRMRGHHRRFRPRTDEHDTNTEGCEAQINEQERTGRGRWNSFRGRGMRGRMRGYYRRFGSRANDDEEDEFGNENSAEMERWNAQVAEEEKLMGRGRLIAFPGTGAFPDTTCDVINQAPGIQEEGEFSDTEWEGSLTVTPHRKHPVASRALMSLIGSYTSDQSDGEGGGECTTSEPLPVVTSNAGNSCSNDISEGQPPEEAVVQDDSDDAPEEAPIVFEKPIEEPPAVLPTTDGNTDETGHHNRRRRHKGRAERWQGGVNATETTGDKSQQRPVATRPWYPRQRRPTLLDKLLREEIRHERNVLLQCINHVVKCNFFNGLSVPEAMDTTTCGPPDKIIKAVGECVSHIVNCGLFDKDDSVTSTDNLTEYT